MIHLLFYDFISNKCEFLCYDEFDLLGQNRLNVNKKLESINGANVLLNETLYWTSTERDYKKAWSYSFGNNFNGDTFKSDYQYVRAIRSF